MFVTEKDLEFPSSYPVGCLLGCVDVVDCLPQDTYQEQVNSLFIIHYFTVSNLAVRPVIIWPVGKLKKSIFVCFFFKDV